MDSSKQENVQVNRPSRPENVRKKRAGKTSRRQKEQYPGLVPDVSLKMRYEEISDIASYVDQLTPNEKAWLNDFSEREISAKVDTSTTTKEERKQMGIYDKNNARNRCLMNRERAQGADRIISIDNSYEATDCDETESLNERFEREQLEDIAIEAYLGEPIKTYLHRKEEAALLKKNPQAVDS